MKTMLFSTFLFWTSIAFAHKKATANDTMVLKQVRFVSYRIEKIPYTKYKTYAALQFQNKSDSLITLNYPYRDNDTGITIFLSSLCYGRLSVDSVYSIALIQKIPDPRFYMLMSFKGSYYNHHFVSFNDPESPSTFKRLIKVKSKYRKEKYTTPLPYLDINQTLYEIVKVSPMENICVN